MHLRRATVTTTLAPRQRGSVAVCPAAGDRALPHLRRAAPDRLWPYSKPGSPFALESSFTLSSKSSFTLSSTVSVTEALKLMSDDTHDDMINLDDPSEYEDPVSQRALAFCHVAKLADTVQNEAVKELCLTMLRKLNAETV
jgi:hypothetical protein